MSAPEKIYELVEHFDNHIDELKAKDYKEASLCTDFLNPFFEKLGWDIRNDDKKTERFRDVVQQFSEKDDKGVTKLPDYKFRIGGTPAFYLEAKKPAVNIMVNRNPALQLRRYGWNKEHVNISILSDFENLCIYDTRVKPADKDQPYVARVANYPYKNFIKKWDEIEGYIARENVARGSLDRLLKEKQVKGLREPVDESLLKMIEIWREKLAKEIARTNKNLDIWQLNTAVQRTIDRILFLRICEDRGIENPRTLEATTNGANTYKRLIKLYQNADNRYNSGLFHFENEKNRPTQHDNFTLYLDIDDKVLKSIIKNLYPPNYPFDFSVMPVDILGHVYEKFLGKIIRLTPTHQAKVEEKPEVRKAGGVYYTPKYIVDYIVKNTVGKLVENKTPKEVAKLKILDPACGSGSFLLGAYQFLLNWHLDWYKENDPKKHSLKKKNPPIQEDIKKGWRLTTDIRKEILLNNIYGVDIDTQAVEVAKLNLLLKVLEQENNQDLFRYSKRALPDLGKNIRCGNSLIEWDYFDDKSAEMDEVRKINPFDWDREFPEIIKWSSSPPQPSPQRGEGASNFVPLGLGVRVSNSENIPKQKLIEYARSLRKSQTPTEEIMWKLLRNKRFNGLKFRRQHPVENYILDFYCPEKKIAIEIDGGGHNTEKKLKKDGERDRKILSLGIKTLRFWSNDVVKNIEGVVERIFEEICSPPQPSPQRGEGASNFVPLSLPKGEGLGVRDKGSNRKLASGFGFDAVIGNPPYVRQESLLNIKDYLKDHYQVFNGIADLYVYFFERSISSLKKDGKFGYIVANKWLRAKYGKSLRKYLADKQVDNLIDFGDLPVFKGVSTYPCIITVTNNERSRPMLVSKPENLEFENLQSYVENTQFEVSSTSLTEDRWSLINIKTQQIIDKLSNNSIPLIEYVDDRIFYGIKTGLNEAFVIDEETKNRLITEDPKSAEVIKPCLSGRDITRYSTTNASDYLILLQRGVTERCRENKNPRTWLRERYPSIERHISVFERQATARCDMGDYWWELRSCDYYDEFEKPKIMLPDIAKRGRFTLDESGGVYCRATAYIIGSNEKYLLGVLNTKLISFFFMFLSSTYRGGYLRFTNQYLSKIPIRTIDFENKDDVSKHDKMVSLVEQMLKLNKQLNEVKSSHDKKLLPDRLKIPTKR